MISKNQELNQGKVYLADYFSLNDVKLPSTFSVLSGSLKEIRLYKDTIINLIPSIDKKLKIIEKLVDFPLKPADDFRFQQLQNNEWRFLNKGDIYFYIKLEDMGKWFDLINCKLINNLEISRNELNKLNYRIYKIQIL